MRTPLNAILGSTDLLLHGGGVPAGLQSHLARIDDSGRVLMRLISDMLDLSKIEAGQVDIERVPIDLGQCLECSLAPIADRARSKGIDFQVALDASVPRSVLSDPDRLRQIVANLADNAVKFTDAGFVRVEAQCHDAGEPDRVLMEIRVLDSGPGIPAEAREKVFERFVQGDSSTTRRKGGAGLGLSIVKSLVEALGGRVSLRGRPEGGTEFRVTLPLTIAAEPRGHEPEPRAGGPSADLATAAGRPARILVAEDNDAGFAVLEAYLARAGHAVVRAANGRDAVAAAAGCDLVLMDVEMPEMDGLEATRRIRALERERGAQTMPIIALTAHALEEYRGRCVAAGCSGYLTKPIRMQPLLDSVAAALEASSTSRQ
jgi:CheY-like chemotaxis protein/anti-sigma regulatory factor (Ser/Thr protein kinase)